MPNRTNVDPQTAAQRRWTRLNVDPNSDDTTLYLADGSAYHGLIVDSSFGGIGVALLDTTGIEIGDELQAEYCGSPMRATVRCVKPNPEGTHFIGLEWVSRKR